MHCNSRLILKSFLQSFDCFVMFFLNCDNRLLSMCDFHAVFDTADYFICLCLNLLCIVLQSRFTLSSIDQDISTVDAEILWQFRVDLRIDLSHRSLCQVHVKLNSCRESSSSHSNYSGCFYHIQFTCIFRHIDRHEFIRLLVCSFNDDSVICNLCYFSVYTGIDVSSKSSRCSNQCTFFYICPNFNARCTRRANMLT